MQTLEIAVLLCQLDIMLLFTMDGDAELEEINTFTSLDYLIVEFGANVGALDVV